MGLGKQVLFRQNTLVHNTTWITDKKLLHFKFSKLGQILHVDKNGFPRPGYILAV